MWNKLKAKFSREIQVIELETPFQIDAGAPMPVVQSNEHDVYLTFYIRSERDEDIVSVRFHHFRQFKFGSPNDEAIGGHPYYPLGLRPYRVQEVLNSDWIEALRVMNSVHHYHDDAMFKDYRHLIFFFHDRCFEIVCERFSIETESEVLLADEVVRISKLL